MNLIEATSVSQAAIYARVSMPKQKSIPSQIDLCRNECTRRDIPVRYILKDQGVSAKTEDRPGYQRLLDLIAQRRITTLVAWKLDRLVRSMKHFVDFTQLLEDSNVALISLTEQIDTSSAFGRFNFRNIASVAELERELIGERAQMGRYRMAREGRWPTNVLPLGYDWGDNRRLAVNPERARLVQRIFREYNQGLPSTEISRRLSAAGVTGTMGRPIDSRSIRSLVRNPLYTGQMKILDVLHYRPDLRIIQDRTFQKAQGRRGKRCNGHGAAKRRQAAIDAVFGDYFSMLEAESTLAPTAG